MLRPDGSAGLLPPDFSCRPVSSFLLVKRRQSININKHLIDTAFRQLAFWNSELMLQIDRVKNKYVAPNGMEFYDPGMQTMPSALEPTGTVDMYCIGLLILWVNNVYNICYFLGHWVVVSE